MSTPSKASRGTVWRSYKERLASLSERVVEAQRPIRILDALKWDDDVEQAVLASHLKKLPAVDAEYYQKRSPLRFDPKEKLEEFEAIKRDIARTIGTADELGAIIQRNCCEYQDVVRMLSARGTPEFYRYSSQLYGSPKEHFIDGRTTLKEMGLLLYEILNGIEDDELGATYPKSITAEEVVDTLNERFKGYFKDDPVRAKLDDGILSDAAAGSDYIKIKRGALFSERDVEILEVHEGWVHLGTTLNGERQRIATWLSKGPPCTTPVQEGLAVLLEVLNFVSLPSRAHKLNNRILACDKAEDGADFLDICEFYRTEGYDEKECFQLAQRVFRGGVVTGGAPFTKDITYCKGFVTIYNFLCIAIKFGRPELIPFLFAGKVTLDEIPALYNKYREGVIERPRYLPRQFRDLNGLAMWLAYSNFFNRMDLSKIQEHYKARLLA